MICPKCGVTFDDPSFFRCPRCGWQHPDPLSQREGLPWERRREIGRIVALWETTKLLLLSPTTAMRLMRNDRALAAVSYLWVMALIASATNALLFALLYTSRRNSSDAVACWGVILALMVGMGFLGSLSLHAGTTSGRLKMSRRLATMLYHYCAGSALLWASVPYLGWAAAVVHCNVLLVISLVSLSGISRAKAIRILVIQKGAFFWFAMGLLACIVWILDW